MSKKVIKIGSSLGVTLSKSLLRKLGLRHGDEVDIDFSAENNSIEISAAYKPTKQVGVNSQILSDYAEELSKLDNDW